MKKHLLSFSLGVLTFAVGVMADPPLSFFKIPDVQVVGHDETCNARNVSSKSGEPAILWSCQAATSYHTSEEEFESLVARYSIISRTEKRAVVSYFTGEFDAYCVLRLDGDRHNDICARGLDTVRELEHDYFGH